MRSAYVRDKARRRRLVTFESPCCECSAGKGTTKGAHTMAKVVLGGSARNEKGAVEAPFSLLWAYSGRPGGFDSGVT